jgi:hypothetical protein
MASAIGWALARFGLEQTSTRQVRKEISPFDRVGQTAALGRWATLLRWIRAIAAGKLFSFVRTLCGCHTLRTMAQHAAMTLISYAPPADQNAPRCHQAFIGAVQIRMASLM